MDQWVSLDDWKPTPKSTTFRVPSQWRKRQNEKSVECHPDNDELRKIKAHIKHGISDDQIVEIFNISSFTLKKIKRGKYSMYEERNTIPSKEMEQEITIHALKMYQDLKDEIRIEYNISSPLFDKLMEESLFKRKKKKKKKPLEEEPKQEELKVKEDDDEEEEISEDALDHIDEHPEIILDEEE